MSQNIRSAIKDLIALGGSFGYYDRQTNRDGTNRDNGLRDVLDEVRLSSGIGDEVLVNDCEAVADWTESTSGEFDVAIEDTIIKVGTYSIKLSSTTAASGNVSTNYINAGTLGTVDPFTGRRQQNWNNSDFVIFWGTTDTNAHFATAGDMTLNIANYGDPTAGQVDWGTAVNVPAVTYDATNIWRSLAIEITSFTRNKVEQIRFENEEPTGSQDIYIDQIVRCKFTDGKGPLRAPCIPLPAKSAEVILQGNIVRYDVTTRRAINWVSAAAGGDVGPCVIPGTGNAAGTVMVWIANSGIARMRTAASSGCAADDSFAGGSVNTIIDTANMAAEPVSIGKTLESPAEDSTGGHDIDCFLFGIGEGFNS